jgi:signal transduction histidine kinase
MTQVHPDDRADVERDIARALESRSSLDVEFRVVWSDGSEHWLAMKGNVVAAAGLAPARVVGIFLDVTQQKATAEALVRTEKLAAAGRLAATIAHEINNPLAALTNLLFILRNDKTLSRAGTEYLKLAEEELARVSRLAQQSLGFYKEQATPSAFSVSELLDEVLALYARNMPATIKVEKHYGNVVDICGIRGEIWQVFANVIANATHVMQDGGTLTIKAENVSSNGGTGILVRIGDTGPGIRAEHLDRIFQPFFTTRPEGGTGLGLWIAKDLVNKHGGRIQVESRTGEGHGTTIIIFLPAAAEGLAQTASTSESLASCA